MQAGLRGNGPMKRVCSLLTNTISVLLAIFIVLRFGELIYRDKLSLSVLPVTSTRDVLD